MLPEPASQRTQLTHDGLPIRALHGNVRGKWLHHECREKEQEMGLKNGTELAKETGDG